MTGPPRAPRRGHVDVLTMGECLAALHAPVPVELLPSLSLTCVGAESNVAIGLSRLGHDVTFIGRVGDDGFGRAVVRVLRAESVRSHIEVGAEPTGLITFIRTGAVTDVEYRRAGAAGSQLHRGLVDRALEGLAGPPRIAHLTGITPALGQSALDTWRHLVTRLGELQVPFVLDVNHRHKLWDREAARSVLQPLAHAADTVAGDDDELLLLCPTGTSDPARHLLDRGVEVVLRKRGPDGVEVVTARGRTSVPARPTDVVDLVGAGDALAAGYISGRLDGHDAVRAAHRGTVLAAFAIAGMGDWTHLPRREQLQAAGEVRR